jgi:hypothetical protein
MRGPLLPSEVSARDNYPEGRNPWGQSDVSVCGPILMTEPELAFLLSVIPERGAYCELGSWSASGLSWIADRRPEVRCVGVDSFEGPSNRRMFGALANWGLRPNVDLFLGRIEHFAWQCDYFDAVLVDGDHHGFAVYRDLSVAEQIVKRHGVILTHDCGAPDHAEVQPAVERFCAERGWVIAQRCDSLALLRWFR